MVQRRGIKVATKHLEILGYTNSKLKYFIKSLQFKLALVD